MPTPPNILILMSDEQRPDTLGCSGNPAARTPHLDRLAATGTRFDQAYTPYPLCCPAQASLWTGLSPHRHGVLGNLWGICSPTNRVSRPGWWSGCEAGGGEGGGGAPPRPSPFSLKMGREKESVDFTG